GIQCYRRPQSERRPERRGAPQHTLPILRALEPDTRGLQASPIRFQPPNTWSPALEASCSPLALRYLRRTASCRCADACPALRTARNELRSQADLLRVYGSFLKMKRPHQGWSSAAGSARVREFLSGAG